MENGRERWGEGEERREREREVGEGEERRERERGERGGGCMGVSAPVRAHLRPVIRDNVHLQQHSSGTHD